MRRLLALLVPVALATACSTAGRTASEDDLRSAESEARVLDNAIERAVTGHLPGSPERRYARYQACGAFAEDHSHVQYTVGAYLPLHGRSAFDQAPAMKAQLEADGWRVDSMSSSSIHVSGHGVTGAIVMVGDQVGFGASGGCLKVSDQVASSLDDRADRPSPP